MDLTFLSAGEALCKTINADGTMSAYPMVKNFTSVSEQVSNLDEMLLAIEKHALQGNCLLKGNVSAPLCNESRAGATNPAEQTEWVCLDVDGVSIPTPELFLQTLGISCSAIVQYSNSTGVKPGLRCHIFIMLDRPQSPEIIKVWLQHLNISTPMLANSISLVKTGNALLWPLDITTCQNDKLLYIAPPALAAGVTDPLHGGNRIYKITGASGTLALSSLLQVMPPPTVVRNKITATIDYLRDQQGLPKRKNWNLDSQNGISYLPNPDEAIVTDCKIERGFVYFNLNGGDSWAYYHPAENPEFIYNFKGEPPYKTSELLPNYWKQIQAAIRKQNTANAAPIYLAFREFRTALYYNGVYHPAEQRLDLAQAKSEAQLKNFLKQYNQPVPEFIRDWSLVWEPSSALVVDENKFTVNTFQPSTIMRMLEDAPTAAGVAPKVPPTIQRVLEHVTGNDPATFAHMVNWLAVIWQQRCMTGTAWVLHGTQGTGKGVLMHHIISPLFGEHNVEAKRAEELESEFTGFFENKFVIFIDEIEVSSSQAQNRVTAKLKNLIVEPTISIRRMYQPAYAAKNYANLIFASNKNQPVEISDDDRRFNVAPYQGTPIHLSSTDVDVRIPAELEEFARFLDAFPADPIKARKPLKSAARDAMISVTKSSIETICDNLRHGNFEELLTYLPSQRSDLNSMGIQRTQLFNQVRSALQDALNGENKLTREEIFAILEFTIGGMPQAPAKFTQLIKHKKLTLKQIWKNKANVRGIEVNWIIPEDKRQEFTDRLAQLK